MSAYSLTEEGYVYFTHACTNSERWYLCGARISHSGKVHTYPTIKAYYSPDEDKRLTVWQWYEAVCEVLPKTDCTLCLPIEAIVGSDGWRAATSAPWILSAGSKHVRVRMYDPVYCSKLGIYWEAIDSNGNEYTTNLAVTPESLAAAPKPSAPVLKPQSPQEWAFKVGTLCTPNTPAPDWNELAEHKGHRWVAKACRPLQVSAWITVEDLDSYYQLGTLCKVGTQLSDLLIKMWGSLPTTDTASETHAGATKRYAVMIGARCVNITDDVASAHNDTKNHPNGWTLEIPTSGTPEECLKGRAHRGVALYYDPW